MNRKLLLLNLALAAVAVYAGVLLRGEWKAAKAREAAMRHQKVMPAPVAPFAPLPKEAPVLATTYQDIAVKTLFHPSRDSKIPVDPGPPPPPPRPMPALPHLHGTLNIGDGPMAILTLTPSTAGKPIKPGQTIGEFKLIDFNTVDMTFEWTFNGQIVRRTLNELMDRTVASAPSGGETARSVSSSAPPPAAAAAAKTPLGPGAITNQGTRLCQPNDSTPDGTVVNGFRKASIPTPFGPACVWDPVGK